MHDSTQAGRPSKAALWAGWILTVLPVLLLLMGATMAITRNEKAVEGTVKMGYPEHLLLALGIVELACAVIYIIPQTAVLGAILLTGYLGGATATHVRIGESPVMAIVVGVVVWLGLFLREPRLRALVPLRR